LFASVLSTLFAVAEKTDFFLLLVLFLFQVELRVSRASLTPTGQVDMGRPMLGPDVCLSRSYSRGVLPAPGPTAAARAGNARPAVTISDPLGGTLMLNPNSVNSGAASLGTRIQVGQTNKLFISLFYSARLLNLFRQIDSISLVLFILKDRKKILKIVGGF
jgi:hypothetical protein